MLPADPAERIAVARRIVADRCLYGVDINPMAVEMAKLSLWLVTVDKNRPFTFLDHAFKCGDSLLGITALEQLENFSLRPGGGKQLAFSTLNLWRHIEEAKKKREALEAMPSDTPEQIAGKAALYAEAEEAVAKLNAAADVLVSVELEGLKGKAYEAERETAADHMMAYWAEGLSELQDYARQRLGNRRCFHWALAFPEITEAGGFHAFVGNPPFVGGARISRTYGNDYLHYLILTNSGAIGNADLASYFIRRFACLLRDFGAAGVIATNSIAKGETRESGLQYIVDSGFCIYRATKSQPWPGAANVFVSIMNFHNGAWAGRAILEDKQVPGISSFLDSHHVEFKPIRLAENLGIVFRGPTIGGEGFILSSDEASAILNESPACQGIIKPFLTGQDINQHPEQVSDRFVIDFGDMDEKEAKLYLSSPARSYIFLLNRSGAFSCQVLSAWSGQRWPNARCGIWPL